MKRLSKVLVLLLVLLALGGCHAFYGGTRDSGENRLEMEYSVLNTLDQEIFKLRAGDVVLGDIVNESGTLRVTVKPVGGEPIYEDLDASTGHIEVEVEESGSYWVQVEGQNAKGSVRFTVREGK